MSLADTLPILGGWLDERLQGERRKAASGGPGRRKGYGQTSAALLMLVYPRWFNRLEDIGRFIGSSGGVIRKWRADKEFLARVRAFETEFLRCVLSRLRESEFLIQLYNSPNEPAAWSDWILHVFCLELANTIHPSGMWREAATTLRQSGAVPDWEFFVQPVILGEDEKDNTILFGAMAADLILGGSRAIGATPKKRGRPPQHPQRFRTTEFTAKVLPGGMIFMVLDHLLAKIQFLAREKGSSEKIMEEASDARKLIRSYAGSFIGEVGKILQEGRE